MACCGRQRPIYTPPQNNAPRSTSPQRTISPPTDSPAPENLTPGALPACEFRHPRPPDPRFRVPIFYCSRFSLVVNENHCKKCISEGKNKPF